MANLFIGFALGVSFITILWAAINFLQKAAQESIEDDITHSAGTQREKIEEQ